MVPESHLSPQMCISVSSDGKPAVPLDAALDNTAALEKAAFIKLCDINQMEKVANNLPNFA